MRLQSLCLRALLGLVAIYHLVLGLLGLFARQQAPDLARTFFRFRLSGSPETLWLLNPFSAYLLAFGAATAVAAWNPVRFRPLVFVVVGLFTLRIVQRLVFLIAADDSLKAAVSPVQNVIHLCVVAALAAAILALALRSSSKTP